MKIHALQTATVLLALFSIHSDCHAQAPDPARVSEIAQWISTGTSSAAPAITDRQFWQRVASSSSYESAIKEAEQIAREPLVNLPDDLYLEYSRVGNRSRYEKVYFAKLNAFRTLVIAECMEAKGRFIAAIEQAIQSYAADKSWVLPAHDSGNENFEGRQITVDLFASEVGCELANADCILGHQLGSDARTLMQQEVRRRVLEPYRQMVTTGQPAMWWLTGTNNWNAVCLANVTGAALAITSEPAERAFYVAAAEKYITNFLTGFTEDGYCSEGVGYWNYGYGCFVRLAHVLHGATGGHVDLFELPRAKSAGLFARRMVITPGQYPAFADCGVGSLPSANIMRYVTRRFQLKPTAEELHHHNSLRWLDELGVYSFVFDPATDPSSTAEPDLRDWFADAGILICRGATSSDGLPVGVALKGGHNAEHHNHNDVGSFVFCIGDTMTLVDPGAEVYTRRTFSNRRYDSNLLNSFGHGVPRVANQLQRTGGKAKGEVVKLEFTGTVDTLALDVASAYSVESLKKLERTFEFHRDAAQLMVTDSVEFHSPQTFETALITFSKWQQLDHNHLLIGEGPSAVLVTIDTAGIPWTVESTEITEERRDDKKPTRLGIELSEPVQAATIRMMIRPSGERSDQKTQ